MDAVVTWDDWPEESFNDPECRCSIIENHFYCAVHGGHDMALALKRYKRRRPQLFPKQREFSFMELEIKYRRI